MDFVLDKVRQLQHIGVANSDRMIEWLASSSIEQLYLACIWQIGTTQVFFDVFFCSSIKDWCSNLNAQRVSGPAQVRFHDLPDIHTVWHTQRVQDNIHWCTVGQEWHILNRQYPRYDALVAMTSGHFVASADFSLLGNTDTHQLINAWRQFITLLSREYFHFNNFAALTMRYTQ